MKMLRIIKRVTSDFFHTHSHVQIYLISFIKYETPCLLHAFLISLIFPIWVYVYLRLTVFSKASLDVITMQRFDFIAIKLCLVMI